MQDVPNKCPLCEGEIEIKSIECTHCNTEINGRFQLSRFAHMDSELLKFIEIFVVSEGNFKQVERILNCSYPKVKNYLKRAASAFGHAGTIKQLSQGSGKERRKILEGLNSGSIDVDEAIKLLNKN